MSGSSWLICILAVPVIRAAAAITFWAYIFYIQWASGRAIETRGSAWSPATSPGKPCTTVASHAVAPSANTGSAYS